MLFLVPALRRNIKCVIVTLFGLLDHLFQADIASHLITGPIKQEKRQKSGHTAVSVKEGMDAKEIEDISWNEKKRFILPRLPKFGKSIVKVLHGLGSQMSGNRMKTNNLRTIGLDLISFSADFHLPP